MSVMEMSHRSKAFEEIIKTAESDLRELMHIPDNYKVLFFAGRSVTAVCDDSDELDEKSKVADYIVTGQMGKKGIPGSSKIW